MKQATELLPTKTSFRVGCDVEIEVRAAPAPGVLTVIHFGDEVARVDVAGDGIVNIGPLAPGGYGIALSVGGAQVCARTAAEVLGTGVARLRYGFVVDYTPARDIDAVSDNIRRLHLTDVQFYDWAYRHADLLGGGNVYDDALGQPVALETVQRLVRAVQAVGARALGYAAVYAVGNDEWPLWRHLALLQASGEPHGLGDFLSIVDPADPAWSAHFTADLCAARERVGFDGFHLDQYGYPKRAIRPDGGVVVVEESFATIIADCRAAMPSSQLIFNNVNDFPTWRTGSAAQDAVYIEVWAPHLTLEHLASLVRRSQAFGGGKPVVFAAYQHLYVDSPVVAADLATAFTMATLFSHGATQLLCGEADRILVDPYYVHNHVVEPSTAQLLHRWYDFLVEHVELLQDATAVDVTGAFAGSYNGDTDVTYEGAVVTEAAVAGAVWRRIVQVGDRLVVHLINLVGQHDSLWDAPRELPGATGAGELRVRRSRPTDVRVRIADPDRSPQLIDVPIRIEGDHVVAVLPPLNVWQVLVIDL